MREMIEIKKGMEGKNIKKFLIVEGGV